MEDERIGIAIEVSVMWIDRDVWEDMSDAEKYDACIDHAKDGNLKHNTLTIEG